MTISVVMFIEIGTETTVFFSNIELETMVLGYLLMVSVFQYPNGAALASTVP